MHKKLFFLLLFAIPFSLQSQIKKRDIFDIAKSGTVSEMIELIKIKQDTINSVNKMGFNPLILACYKDNAEVAKYLIPRVKELNYNSTNGTALSAVVVKGNNQLLEILLTNKANPNIGDSNGITPLIYAIQFKNKPMIVLLLKYNADKNLGDNTGKKPFEYAVLTEDNAIINLLKN